MRLAAAGFVAPPADGAGAAAAAAAAVASPSKASGGALPQPVTTVDDVVVLARLSNLLARQLLSVLPASRQEADLAIAAIESAALARANVGEPDLQIAGSPTRGGSDEDPFSA